MSPPPRLQAGVILEHPVGGHLHVLGIGAPAPQAGQREAGRRDRGGDVVVLLFGRVAGRGDYAVADLEILDPFAQFGHLARGVGAQDVGKGKLWDD